MVCTISREGRRLFSKRIYWDLKKEKRNRYGNKKGRQLLKVRKKEEKKERSKAVWKRIEEISKSKSLIIRKDAEKFNYIPDK